MSSERDLASYILIHQACLADTAIAEDDNLYPSRQKAALDGRSQPGAGSMYTFRRTFLREAMVLELVDRRCGGR